MNDRFATTVEAPVEPEQTKKITIEDLVPLAEEVTSEVTSAPKKRGRPPKAKVVTDASPPEAPMPVTVVISEASPPAPPPAQSMSARTLAEIAAGQRILDKYRR